MFQNVKHSDIETGLRLYAADFETTTGAFSETSTRVWSFCVDEIGHFKPEIYGSIEDFFDFCGNVEKGFKKRLYFHNLSFDGQFIISAALDKYGFRTALDPVTNSMRKAKDLIEREIVYAVSDVGQWYFISFVYKGCRVEVRDSFKIMPMELREVGKGICTRYKKSEMNYDDKTGLDDCTEADLDYIKNDVLVLSEALSKMLCLDGGDNPFGPIQSLTIGGACWQMFKQTIYGETKNVVIHLDKMDLPPEAGSPNADAYIRQGYRGGYCYVNRKYENQLINKPGFTADVNSLYPFVMCWKYSGFWYPYGPGKYEKGQVREEWLENDNYYFYARILVSFKLRSGFVPTVQKKHTFLFMNNLYLASSQIYDAKTKAYVGKPQEIELTLAKDDYILFMKHYEILSFKALDYIVFATSNGLCDPYIERMAAVKMESTKSGNKFIRTTSKLFSNNLYGQFSKGTNSSFKVAELDEDGKLKYHTVDEHEKKVTNIAIGAAVTSHARFYQINTIQDNYDRFLYSDTDSIHALGDPSEFVGKIDPVIYGAYDIENRWTRARFVRQKTYIEENADGSGWTICAAGMTQKQKDIFRRDYQFEDFKIGLKITGGKLLPKQVQGGIILKDADFTLN